MNRKKLLKKIAEGDDTNNLTDEQLLKAARATKKKKSDRKYFALSYQNWTEHEARKFMLTSVVAFLFRVVGDYTPYEIKKRETDEFNAVIKGRSLDEIAELRKIKDDRIKEYAANAKKYIMEFLIQQFNYDPDIHTAAKYEPSNKEVEQVPVDDHVLTAYSELKGLKDQIDETLKLLMKAREHNPTVYSISRNLIRQKDKVAARLRDLEPVAVAMQKANAAALEYAAVPVDVFYHFERFINNNYDELNKKNKEYHPTESLVDISLTMHDVFDSPEAANEYVKKHQADNLQDILVVANDGITLIGPWEKNLEGVQVVDNDLLTRMFDERAKENKLAEDMIKKQVKKKKDASVAEVGLDAPSLAEYKQLAEAVSEYTIKSEKGEELTDKEKFDMANAKERMAHLLAIANIPEDAIAVDFMVTDGETMTKKTIYTEAEAPKLPES